MSPIRFLEFDHKLNKDRACFEVSICQVHCNSKMFNIKYSNYLNFIRSIDFDQLKKDNLLANFDISNYKNAVKEGKRLNDQDFKNNFCKPCLDQRSDCYLAKQIRADVDYIFYGQFLAKKFSKMVDLYEHV